MINTQQHSATTPNNRTINCRASRRQLTKYLKALDPDIKIKSITRQTDQRWCVVGDWGSDVSHQYYWQIFWRGVVGDSTVGDYDFILLCTIFWLPTKQLRYVRRHWDLSLLNILNTRIRVFCQRHWFPSAMVDEAKEISFCFISESRWSYLK